MQGRVANYDKKHQRGIIACGKSSYVFTLEDWQEELPPYNGCRVEFGIQNKKLSNLKLLGEYRGPQGEPVKSKLVAGLLGLLLGWAGAHRFYLGFYKTGILQIIVSVLTLGVGAIWGFTEGALILLGRIEMDAKHRPLS